jgi:hypothetical protein
MSDEKPVSKRVWQINNESLKPLPTECKEGILEIVKENVRLCIANHGIDDPICQAMALESQEMEEYLLYNPSKKVKCDRNPCNLTIKHNRKELKSNPGSSYEKEQLKKQLSKLQKGELAPSDIGLEEFSKERAIKIIKEEIEELD